MECPKRDNRSSWLSSLAWYETSSGMRSRRGDRCWLGSRFGCVHHCPLIAFREAPHDGSLETSAPHASKNSTRSDELRSYSPLHAVVRVNEATSFTPRICRQK